MTDDRIGIIGGLINNAYARARRAFGDRDLEGYQNLAKLQDGYGVDFLDFNIDATQRLQVRLEEMLEFLPELIPAVQEASPTPLCFDNPSYEFHKVALENYDQGKSGAPILNSLAASRERLDEMIELVREYDTYVIAMVSERFVEGGSAQCLSPDDAYATAKYWVDLLTERADRRLDQIIIDPGLAPVGADTYGLVNIGLDTMRLISNDPNLKGVHIMVGLTNFAWGTPKTIRPELEKAYLTLGRELGLDMALANPEIGPAPLPVDDPLVDKLRSALAAGRPRDGESQETAGFRQAEAIMEICADAEDDDW